MSELYIGFTTKYYTLWEVTYDGKWAYYHYIQNLSMSLEKAKAKQPTAMVDLSLKGHKSFKVEATPMDCFKFGKFKGQRFTECNDITYLAWYYNTLFIPKSKNILKPILIEGGYKEWYDMMLDDTTYNTYTAIEKALPMLDRKIQANAPISFKCNKNLKKVTDEEDGDYCINDNPLIQLVFRSYKENEYNGYKYYTPTNKSGYNASIKGKRMIVTDYNATKIDDTHYRIIVNDFSLE